MANDDAERISSLYHALRATRRRWVIRVITTTDENIVSVRELAREIAATENSLPLSQATGEPYRNVYNALSQTHLPTLAEASIVIYDPKRQTVSPGPNIEAASLLIAIDEAALRSLNEYCRWYDSDTS